MKKKLSLTYRFLDKIGLHYSEEEYGQIGPLDVIGHAFRNPYHALLLSMMNWVIFEPIAPRMLRPWLMRRMGCKVGKGVYVGDHVFIDLNHANLITVEEHAHIAGGCRLLCHQRNLKGYCQGDDYANLGYILKPIRLCKGSLIGMETFVLPGVTIGDGAIVGAGSLVTRDIPAWTIATGRPARAVKEFPKRED